MAQLKTGTTAGGSVVLTDATHDSTGDPHTQYKLKSELTSEYYTSTTVDALLAQNSIDDTAASAGYAAAAQTSATNAAASETNAASSASQAATSATNANTSAGNAATSEANTAAIYDQFDDRYLGAKASDPTLDNDGAALLTGALYFNTSANEMRVYNGSAWQVYLSAAGLLAQIKTVDGAGSGLDADTVDGREVTSTTTDTTTGKLLKVGDLSIAGYSDNSTGSANDFELPGRPIWLNAAATDKPAGTGAGALIPLPAANTSTNSQLFIESATSGDPKIYFRQKNSSTTSWNSWVRLINTSDVTSASNDTTTGKVTKVGDYGLGLTGSTLGTDALDNLNHTTFISTGASATTGWPVDYGSYPMGFHIDRSSTVKSQLAMGYGSGGDIAWRNTTDAGPVWSNWKHIYHNENTVGTVSQSGGTPTGAIIEKGSNANGRYTKYADGTLICTRTYNWVDSITIATGSGYQSTSTASLNFPHSFTSASSVDVSISTRYSSGGVRAWHTLNSKTATDISVLGHSFASAASPSLYVDYIAVGRWY